MRYGTKYARIVDGDVVEIIYLPNRIDVSTAFHPDLVILECPDWVSVGCEYDGQHFKKPPKNKRPKGDKS